MSFNADYRPKSLDELVGQQHIADIINAQLAANKFSHTYLLYGPRGTGKTTTARILAKAVNISSGDLQGDPIAEMIEKGQTIDYVEIDAASHTGVDNIREEIIDKALYPPTQLTRKVYVIDEVHMLSKGAFNALLKIMEEPPEYLLFILATTEIHKVPDTIVSRSQVFNFKRLQIADIVGRLEFICGQENIEFEPDALRLIAKMANGGVRDAIKYLEQISMLGKVTVQTVSGFLGVVSEQSIVNLLEVINSGQFENVVSQLDQLQEQGADMTQLAKDILFYLDEHFLDDPSHFSKMARVFKEITMGIKSYPHPIIIYKMHLWEIMNPSDKGAGSSEHRVQKPKVKDTPPNPEAPQTPVAPPAEPTPESVAEVEDGGFDEVEDEAVPPTPASVVEAEGMTEYEYLMSQIIEKVDKLMIKSIMKKNVIIDKLEADVLDMIVVNEQYYNTLSKPETITYMQDIVTSVRSADTKVKFTYMNKEEYLQKQLMG